MRFAIVGISALMPGSADTAGFYRTVVEGRDHIVDVPPTHWLVDDYFDADPATPDRTYGRRGAFLDPVRFDPVRFGVPPESLPATDTTQLLALVATEQLLADLACGDIPRERTSVVLGGSALELLTTMACRTQRPVWLRSLRESGIEETQAQAICDRIAGHYPRWTEATFPGLLGNVVAGRIANRFDLHGTNCVVDAACASSLAALSHATNELALGQADLVLTGGADNLQDILMFMCFGETGALSPTGDCRPFSDGADGTVLGEGLVVLGVKRLEDAERDGDGIYAVIRGMGTSSDGRASAIYAPVPEGQQRALRRAYQAAGYGPETVGLVEAHGTGTAAGDAAEFSALREVFDASGRADRQWSALGSVKSQVGHTKSAAGAVGVVKAALALHQRVLPPTVKVERPNPVLDIDDSPFYLNTRARPWIRDPSSHPRRASVSSFGFGGSNFHVTLEEYDPKGEGHPAPRLRAMPAELVTLSAESRDALLAHIDELARDTRTLPELARASQETFRATHHARVALVATDRADLDRRLERAAGAVAQGADAPGVHHARGDARPGAVAFLFPGQGGQYTGMGADVAMHFPEARETWDRLATPVAGDRALHDVVFPVPALDDPRQQAQEAELTATEWAQPALAVHSTALLAVLRRLGVTPDCVGGHSFGELTALHAAGVFGAEDLVRLARRRGELMRDAAVPGAMLAVQAPPAEITRICPDEDVCVANLNGPRQTVLAGRLDTIERVAGRLSEGDVTTRRLNAAAAFHSPLVADAAEPLTRFLGEVEVHPPRIDTYGNADAAPYPRDPDTVRRRVGEHLTSPVRFADMVDAMHEAGVGTFVEVGAGAALTGLVAGILGERGHTAVSLDHRGRNGVTSLLDALGALAVRGVQMDLTALWAGSEPAPASRAESSPATVEILGVNHQRSYPPGGDVAPPPPVTPAAVPDPVAPDAGGAAPVTPDLVAPDPVAPDPGGAAPRLPDPPVGGEPVPEGAASEVRDGQWLHLLQEAQQRTADAHATYQRLMADSHQEYLRTVERSLSNVASTLAAPGETPPTAWTPPDTSRSADTRTDVPTTAGPPVPASPTGPAGRSDHTAGSRPVAESTATGDGPTDGGGDLSEALVEVIADKTGYPTEMLGSQVDLELEADLGIDSIKRVEILSALRRRIPELPQVDAAELGGLRTIRQILDRFDRHAPEPSPGKDGDRGGGDAAPTPGDGRADSPTVTRLAVRCRPVPSCGLSMAGLRHRPVVITRDTAGVAERLAERMRSEGVAAEVAERVPSGTPSVVHLGGLGEITSVDDALAVQRDAFRAARDLPAGEPGVFVTVQDTGGDFGLAGEEPLRAWSGGLAALVRTLARESPEIAVKAIDCARAGRDPRAVADAVADELRTGGPRREVGLRADGTRTTPVAVQAPPACTDAARIGPESVIVVTGGARGVTAAALAALARDRQPRLVLLGRTPLRDEPPDLRDAADEAAIKRALYQRAPGTEADPAEIGATAARVLAVREIRATIEALERAGSPVLYVSADVRDGTALATALDEARARWGPVTGIVHGAGRLADGPLAEKSDDQFDRVFDTKVGGLRALLDATEEDPLDTLCVFSSVAAHYGNEGQSDYAMANEVLNQVASAQAARRPGCVVRSVGWGPWDGGMVDSALAARFRSGGVSLIPPADGARAFTEELTDTSGDARVLTVAGDAATFRAGGELRAEIPVRETSHPHLVDHAIKGEPVVPMALAVEWLLAMAMEEASAPDGVVLHDVAVVSRAGLEPLQAVALPHGEVGLRGVDGSRRYTARARAGTVSPGRWDPPPAVDGAEPDYDGHVLFHGPAFQVLRSVHDLSPAGASAVTAGAWHMGWGETQWRTDPGAVDGAMQTAVLWAREATGHATLPMAVREVRLHRQGLFDAPVTCAVRAGTTHDDGAECDIGIVGDDGHPHAELLGVSLVRRPT